MDYYISLVLDTRNLKKNGKYPLKLRVYSGRLQKAKLYKTKFEFTESGLKSLLEAEKPRGKNKETRLEMQSLETDAHEKAKNIKPFSFEAFERKLYLRSGESQNVFTRFKQIIDRNIDTGRIGNADVFRGAMNSIKDYLKETKGKEVAVLRFGEVTPEWLTKYAHYQMEVREVPRSRTTVAIYLRALRVVFNEAIKESDIQPDTYPFGKDRFKIPNVNNIKKALSWEQLKKLHDAEPGNDEQRKARDFWFFSYATSGMNVKDIALLKYDDLYQDKIVYYRAKTKNTASELKPITVYLNAISRKVIEDYKIEQKGKSGYVFSIINDSMNDVEKHRAVKNFTRFINQNIKKLAVSIDLPSDISSYHARHSYASNAIRKGASMEEVSEALNHNNMNTTKRYFNGFEEDTKREMSNTIVDF